MLPFAEIISMCMALPAARDYLDDLQGCAPLLLQMSVS